MSLKIDTDKVQQVLLPVVGWIMVAGESFDLDSYEYVWGSEDDRLLLGGGQEKLIPATGFVFKGDDGKFYAGPLTSVLAVQY